MDSFVEFAAIEQIANFLSKPAIKSSILHVIGTLTVATKRNSIFYFLHCVTGKQLALLGCKELRKSGIKNFDVGTLCAFWNG